MDKRLLIRLSAFLLCLEYSGSISAQTWDEWFNQKATQRKYLLEQIAKLQLYTEYVKKGYDVAQQGLRVVGDIKNGDLNMHQLFFNSLEKVNPSIKRDKTIKDIVALQQGMLSAYEAAKKQISQSRVLTAGETEYFNTVFGAIINQAADDIQQLTEVLTDGRLKMKDDERIKKINAVYQNVSGKSATLYEMIATLSALINQRQQELKDVQTLKKIFGL